MDNIFGFDRTGIEAQYKRDRFMEEAKEYRIMQRNNFKNNNQLKNIFRRAYDGLMQLRVMLNQRHRTA